MTEQQAKYGAKPSQVSKTAASNPGTREAPKPVKKDEKK